MEIQGSRIHGQSFTNLPTKVEHGFRQNMLSIIGASLDMGYEPSVMYWSLQGRETVRYCPT